MNEIANSILSVVELITDKKIREAGFDKTIVAEVIDTPKGSTGTYTVRYQDSDIKEVLSDSSYAIKDRVYVLIPQSDDALPKRIIGKVNAADVAYDGEFQTEEDSYDIIGGDVVNSSTSFSVNYGSLIENSNSFEKILYSVNSSINEIDFSEKNFQNAIGNSTALIIKGVFTPDFKTLPPEVFDCDYGIRITMADEESNETSFIFNTNDMVGNPWANENQAQFKALPIDFKKWNKVIEVVLYATNLGAEDEVSVSELEIKGGNDAAAKDKRTVLTIETPLGANQTNFDRDLSLSAVFRKDGIKVTEGLGYEWYKEVPPEINGGNKWAPLEKFGNALSLDVLNGYEQNYKCIATYQGTEVPLTLEEEITLTASISQHKLSSTTTKLSDFTPVVKALIYYKAAGFALDEQPLDSALVTNGYSFRWFVDEVENTQLTGSHIEVSDFAELLTSRTYEGYIFKGNEYIGKVRETIPAYSNAIKETKEYYYAARFDKEQGSNKLPDKGTASWVSKISETTFGEVDKYLWNYEELIYTNAVPSTTDPDVIANWSKDGGTGNGIESITEFYLLNNDISKPTQYPTLDNYNEWSTTAQETSNINRYLWNYAIVKYTDGSTDTAGPALIGSHGASPYTLSLDNDFIAVPADEFGNISSSFSYPTLNLTAYYGDQVIAIGQNGYTVELTATNITVSGSGSSYQISGLAADADKATVSFVLKLNGAPLAQTNCEIIKNKQGITGGDGNDAVYVYAQPSTNTFKRKVDEQGNVTYIPDYLSIAMYKRVGSTEPVLDTAAYYTKTSKDSGDAVEGSFTNGRINIYPSGAENEIQVEIYSDSARTKIIDKIAVNIVKDGDKGADGRSTREAYYASETEQNLAAPTITNGSLSAGWSFDSQTLSETNKFIYQSKSVKPAGKNTDWGAFSEPILWAKWGDDGNSITGVVEYYYATTFDKVEGSNKLPEQGSSSWKNKISDTTFGEVNKYLWNYEEIQYSIQNSTFTDPAVVAVWSKDGKGIDKITEYYQVNNSQTSAPSGKPTVSNGVITTSWDTTAPPTSQNERYLWNSEVIKYTDGTYKINDPVVIGTEGYTPVKNQDYFDGLPAKDLSLTASSFVFVQAEDGTITPSSIELTANAQNLTGTSADWAWSGVDSFSTNIATLKSSSMTTDSKTITVSYGGMTDSLTILKVYDGKSGNSPYIENGNWYIEVDGEKQELGQATGDPGKTPYINNDGYWQIGDNPTTVLAQGPQGPKGDSAVSIALSNPSMNFNEGDASETETCSAIVYVGAAAASYTTSPSSNVRYQYTLSGDVDDIDNSGLITITNPKSNTSIDITVTVFENGEQIAQRVIPIQCTVIPTPEKGDANYLVTIDKSEIIVEADKSGNVSNLSKLTQATVSVAYGTEDITSATDISYLWKATGGILTDNTSTSNTTSFKAFNSNSASATATCTVTLPNDETRTISFTVKKRQITMTTVQQFLLTKGITPTDEEKKLLEKKTDGLSDKDGNLTFGKWYNHEAPGTIPLVVGTDKIWLPAGTYDVNTWAGTFWNANNYTVYDFTQSLEFTSNGTNYSNIKFIVDGGELSVYYDDTEVYYNYDYEYSVDEAWSYNNANFRTITLTEAQEVGTTFQGIAGEDTSSDLKAYRWTRTMTTITTTLGGIVTDSAPSWTEAELAESDARITEWCQLEDTTLIDGGSIYADSLYTNMVATNILKSHNYSFYKSNGDGTFSFVNGATNTTESYRPSKGDMPAFDNNNPNKPFNKYDSHTFPNQGSFFDLEKGYIFTPSFKVFQDIEKKNWIGEFSGTLNSKEGYIAGWQITEQGLRSPEVQDNNGSKYQTYIDSYLYNNDITKSTSFCVFEDGDSVFYIRPTGEIYAEKGTVGGWNINKNSLYATSSGVGTGLQTPGTGVYSLAIGYTDENDWSTAAFSVTHGGEATSLAKEDSGNSFGYRVNAGSYTRLSRSFMDFYEGYTGQSRSIYISNYSLPTNSNNTSWTTDTALTFQGSANMRFVFDDNAKGLIFCSKTGITPFGLIRMRSSLNGGVLADKIFEIGTDWNSAGWATMMINASDNRDNIMYGKWHLKGNIYNSNGTLQFTSDRNAKNSIQDVPEQYNVLFDNLRPVIHKFNNGTSDRYHSGFIAQETDEARATAGLTRQDFAAVCIDNEGTEKEEWSLRYIEFIPLNTWQIQKAKARISELEIKNTQLEERLARLEAALNIN